MKMKIYIAGKITGEPVDQCIRKFYRASTNILINYVAESVNPFDLPGIHFGISHNDAMSICFKALKECDAIYMLSDWEDSPGARLEHSQAKDWGLEIIYEDQKPGDGNCRRRFNNK